MTKCLLKLNTKREGRKSKTNLLINDDDDAASQSLIPLIYAIHTPLNSHHMWGKSQKRIEKRQNSETNGNGLSEKRSDSRANEYVFEVKID